MCIRGGGPYHLPLPWGPFFSTIRPCLDSFEGFFDKDSISLSLFVAPGSLNVSAQTKIPFISNLCRFSTAEKKIKSEDNFNTSIFVSSYVLGVKVWSKAPGPRLPMPPGPASPCPALSNEIRPSPSQILLFRHSITLHLHLRSLSSSEHGWGFDLVKEGKTLTGE